MQLFDGVSAAGIAVSCVTIYLWSSDRKLYTFDTLTDALGYIGELDIPSGAKMLSYNGYLYFAGGQQDSSTTSVNAFKRYKISTGELTSLANLYEPLKRTVILQHSDYIYLFGGIDASGYEDGIFRYSFATETWTKLDKKLPEKNSDMCYYMAGDAVYLLLGQQSNGRIWKYDFNSDTLTVCTLKSRYNYGTGFAQIGNAFYAIGSYSESNGFIDKVYKLSFSCELEKDAILFVQDYSGKKIKLVSGQNDVFVYVKNVFRGDDSGQAEYCDVYVYNGANWVNINTGAYYQAA